MSEKVGQRLQLVRKLYGLSQRELAKKADVANSAISVMEQDSVSPSIASIDKVLSGFPLTLSEFLHLNLESPSYTTGEPAELRASAPKLDYFELTENESSRVILCRQPSRLFVLSGSIQMSSLASGCRLDQGQSIVLEPMTLFKTQATSATAQWLLAYNEV
jgi:transcriptional regulator with XRE-family HTH domain